MKKIDKKLWILKIIRKNNNQENNIAYITIYEIMGTKQEYEKIVLTI